MEDRIRALDDRAAIHLLGVMARPHQRASGPEPSSELGGPGDLGDLGEALAAAFGTPAGPSSEGEVARQALLVLAQDPKTAVPLQALLDGPQPKGLTDFTQTVAVITAALVVLKLHVKVERGANGKWKVLAELPASSEPFLKDLVTKLLGLFSRK